MAGGLWYLPAAVLGLGIPGVVLAYAPTTGEAWQVLLLPAFAWLLATGLVSVAMILMLVAHGRRLALVLGAGLVLGDMVLIGASLTPSPSEMHGAAPGLFLLLVHAPGLALVSRSYSAAEGAS